MLKKILNVFKRNFQFQPTDQGWFLAWTDSKPADEADTFHWAYQLEESQMEKAIYLAQLATEGIAQVTESGWLLPWKTLYPLLENKEYQVVISVLELPAVDPDIIPSIDCKNTLSDPDFELSIRYWRKKEKQLENVVLQGGMIQWGKNSALLSSSVWRLWNEILSFRQRSEKARTQKNQELSWGKIRHLALKANARFASLYLENTVILTPETLQLSMQRKDVLGEPIITVNPVFDDAPENWLSRFDRVSHVQPHYDFVSSGDEQFRVILSKPVRRVLEVIKRDMPNRRVVGSKAEAFLRNPYALLGDSSHDVLDEELFTREREKLGKLQSEWSIEPELEQHWIVCVNIKINTNDGVVSESLLSATALKTFISTIEEELSRQRLSYSWRRYRLALNHQVPSVLAQGERIAAMWEQQENSGIHKINYEDIYDLRQYGDRVVGIAEAKPIAIPVILKPEKGDDSWAPELEAALLIQLPNTEDPVLLPATQDFCTELDKHIQAAQEAGSLTVELPYIHLAVPIEDAEVASQVLQEHLRSKSSPESDTPPKEKPIYQTLIIKNNFGNLSYIEQRKRRLAIPDSFQYRLPENLRPEIQLKLHQLEGVRWLQYLSSLKEECHGALLADDMGLGKTLQLLCLLAEFYGQSPDSSPSMIIAPVSLLNNWEQEAGKFFDHSFPKVLRLHGANLKSLKQPDGLIDQQLKSENITNLLQPNWIGDCKLIITTYETIRDYEFSLARQSFEFLICDEAQKIKNPAAMVSLAVKKQKARFKIACTGTPVENNLTDLWCLFDWVQPGLLGTLQEFHASYRRPIEVSTDEEAKALHKLRQLIEPQVLRRMKKDLQQSGDTLPDKIEITNCDRQREDGSVTKLLSIQMSDYQHSNYRDALTRLGMALNDGSSNRSKGSWAIFHRMKAICAEPYCLPGMKFKEYKSIEKHLTNSPKVEWLLQTLDEINAKQEKAIVFTDLREVQRALIHFIHSRFSIEPSLINGTTQANSRQKLIDNFEKKQGFNVILLSPLAAGAGLNIVAANHVIHFTRTWNPAKEAQATDRAYRIGQEKTVYVYCPTVIHSDFISFEERLDQLMRVKSDLANDMLNGIGNNMGLEDLVVVAGQQAKSYTSSTMKITDIDVLDGYRFEVIYVLLLKKEGWEVEHTGGAGDGGVDIVAFREEEALLVQCKHSRSNKSLNWEAVKEVVGGKADYSHRFRKKNFSLVAATNRDFNNNACKQAKRNDVELWQRDDLMKKLLKTPILKVEFDSELASD